MKDTLQISRNTHSYPFSETSQCVGLLAGCLPHDTNLKEIKRAKKVQTGEHVIELLNYLYYNDF